MSDIVLQPAMKAIVEFDDKILLLREADTYEEGTNTGKYHLPGGRVNPGEHFLDGLKREVKEETGLDVEVVRPVHVDEWRPVIKGTPHQIVGTFFHVRATSNEVTLSEEHDKAVWVSIDDYKQYKPLESAALEAYRATLPV